MRILILSDIHANPWALTAIAADAGSVDHVICAGDSVNYGPAPGIVLTWLREHGAICVRGNHDHAIAFGADPQASPAKQPLARAMRDWTTRQLGQDELLWLSRLPLLLQWEIAGTRFAVTHATPKDPLYDYRLTPSLPNAILEGLIGRIQADVLVVGHTHLPMLREYAGTLIINPGSVGQPLDGDSTASYAIWKDGGLELHRVGYDLPSAVAAVRSLPLDIGMRDDLARMLERARTG